jgi:hypothetical protein
MAIKLEILQPRMGMNEREFSELDSQNQEFH